MKFTFGLWMVTFVLCFCCVLLVMITLSIVLSASDIVLESTVN